MKPEYSGSERSTAGRCPHRLGIRGWAVGGAWGFERYLYTVHRITGLGILLYLLMHVVVTSSRVWGPEAWSAAMTAVGGPVFKIGELLVFAAFAFHALNGLRLVLAELGVVTGRAEEPVYPYRSSLDVGRPFMIAVMIVAAFVVVLGGWELFVLVP